MEWWLQGREKYMLGDVSNPPFSVSSSSTSPQYNSLPPHPNRRWGPAARAHEEESARSYNFDLREAVTEVDMNLEVMNNGGAVREHMFDKIVTPSDVGKLNRLVVPKQHAEKYFPLNLSTEKGLILNFEDLGGKEWLFRYSYWNSSQSYVMTKGWSRFVKDKKLNAGDTITFYRAKNRLYIDWKHQCDLPDPSQLVSLPLLDHSSHQPVPWDRQFFDHLHSSDSGPDEYNVVNPGSRFYVTEEVDVVQHGGERIIDTMMGVHGKATAKWVRLFGVNLECPITEGDRGGNGDILSPRKIASVSSRPQLSIYPLQ